MELIENQEFVNETIVFDGCHFIRCTFKSCIIIITSLDFCFDSCSFLETAFYADPDHPIFQAVHTLMQGTSRFWADVYRHPKINNSVILMDR